MESEQKWFTWLLGFDLWPNPSCPVINVPDITFQYGRSDCGTSPNTTDTTSEFPGATMDRASMITYFADWFGYSEQEVTALMGAHTLGKNHLSRSGYNGVFIEGGQSTFDNTYYSDMLTGTWTSEVRLTRVVQVQAI